MTAVNMVLVLMSCLSIDSSETPQFNLFELEQDSIIFKKYIYIGEDYSEQSEISYNKDSLGFFWEDSIFIVGTPDERAQLEEEKKTFFSNMEDYCFRNTEERISNFGYLIISEKGELIDYGFKWHLGRDIDICISEELEKAKTTKWKPAKYEDKAVNSIMFYQISNKRGYLKR
jgi:hypothetical protein